MVAFVFFQYSFTTTTVTILSGGVAGRVRIYGYIIYCVFMSGIMHSFVSHWIWAVEGFLNANNPNALFGVGVLDFAGGLAVHCNGGAATLVAQFIMYERLLLSLLSFLLIILSFLFVVDFGMKCRRCQSIRRNMKNETIGGEPMCYLLPTLPCQYTEPSFFGLASLPLTWVRSFPLPAREI